MKTIKILGGGIAGLTAGINLARNGYNVEIHEKRKNILSKFGPHFCAIRNYMDEDALNELKKYGVNLIPFSVIRKVIKISPNFKKEIKGDLYYVFKRGTKKSLEEQLLEQAKKLGVEIKFNSSLTQKDCDIIATGAPVEKANIIGVGYLMRTRGSGLRKEEILLFYNNDVSPHGYLWIFGSNQNVFILSVSFTELHAKKLFERLDYFLKNNQILKNLIGDIIEKKKIAGFGYYKRNPVEEAVRNGKLFIGEAGGFQDATRGFGIRYAIITGYLAAKSIIEKSDYMILLKDFFKNHFEELFQKRQELNKLTNEDYDFWIKNFNSEESYKKQKEKLYKRKIQKE